MSPPGRPKGEHRRAQAGGFAISSALAHAPAVEAHAYRYVSLWRLDAPIDAVWQALTKVEQWPQWWPHVRRVQVLRRGNGEGVGAIRRIDWGTRLPYGFTLDLECVESQRLQRLRGRSRGHLEGEGLWELWAETGAPGAGVPAPGAEGSQTCVRYTWRLDLNTAWMRLAAPLMAPVFRWNHEGVMHGGALGLARHLGARLIRG